MSLKPGEALHRSQRASTSESAERHRGDAAPDTHMIPTELPGAPAAMFVLNIPVKGRRGIFRHLGILERITGRYGACLRVHVQTLTRAC